jgi:hypothetical protein
MRILGALLVAAALAGAACGPPPPPVFTHAESATAGLRVHINDRSDYLGTGEDEERDDVHRKAIAAAQHALVVRMQEAGYVVVTDKGPWDLSTSTMFSIKRERHQDSNFARARIRLKDGKGNVVDEITLEYRGNAAPASEPDRVAVSLVNEMNKSAKIATFAQSRAK